MVYVTSMHPIQYAVYPLILSLLPTSIPVGRVRAPSRCGMDRTQIDIRI